MALTLLVDLPAPPLPVIHYYYLLFKAIGRFPNTGLVMHFLLVFGYT